jgi:hypothetical protein
MYSTRAATGIRVMLFVAGATFIPSEKQPGSYSNGIRLTP